MMMFSCKSILVTGGTGSFGKKFIRHILENYPEIDRIVVYSRDEFKQFEMGNMPFFKKYEEKLRFFIGDVRDKERMMRAFKKIDVVIHAAALKQVPSCEYNPFEAVKTNILGAQNVINCAIDAGVKRVVALSTDKACAPINLYGATKLCSDKLFIAGNAYAGGSETRFSVVRYGNVAGSRGSVIPFFKHLIAEGAKELPITDFRMTRFWLKLEQAVEMVMDALGLMQGGELFVRKIPSMRMTDLAESIAPGIKLREVGLRPGEKIHEQMITVNDAPNTFDLGKFYVILPQMQFSGIKYDLNDAKPVTPDFEYHSGNNPWFLTIPEMQKMLETLS